MPKKTDSKAAGAASQAVASEASGAAPASPEQRELQQLSEQSRHHERAYRDGAPEIIERAADGSVDGRSSSGSGGAAER